MNADATTIADGNAGGDVPDVATGGATGLTTPPRARRQYGVVIGLVALLVAFSIAHPDTFLTWDNTVSILSESAILAILAVGLTVPLAAGDFDLSIAAVASLAGMLTAVLVSDDGWSIGPIIIVCLGVGLAVGLINGVLVAYVKINAFVATLAMMSVLEGVSIGIAGETYRGALPSNLTDIGRSEFLGLPVVVYFALVLGLVLWYVMRATQFGRYVYSTGSSEIASRVAGVNTSSVRLRAFCISGVLAALAGAVLVARSGSAYPEGAQGLLLPAYAAAFVGSSVLSDGRFHIGGTLVGVILLQAGQDGLIMSNFPQWLTDVFNGAVLALAVGLSRVPPGTLMRLFGPTLKRIRSS
jgi:ribose transport system permease protein